MTSRNSTSTTKIVSAADNLERLFHASDKQTYLNKYFDSYVSAMAHCLKITQTVAFEFLILAFSTNFCHTKTDLSGNTVWTQASGFQKLAKMDYFGIFN